MPEERERDDEALEALREKRRALQGKPAAEVIALAAQRANRRPTTPPGPNK